MDRLDLFSYVDSVVEAAGFKHAKSIWTMQLDKGASTRLDVMFRDLKPYFKIDSPGTGHVVLTSKKYGDKVFFTKRGNSIEVRTAYTGT